MPMHRLTAYSSLKEIRKYYFICFLKEYFFFLISPSLQQSWIELMNISYTETQTQRSESCHLFKNSLKKYEKKLLICMLLWRTSYRQMGFVRRMQGSFTKIMNTHGAHCNCRTRPSMNWYDVICWCDKLSCWYYCTSIEAEILCLPQYKKKLVKNF